MIVRIVLLAALVLQTALRQPLPAELPASQVAGTGPDAAASISPAAGQAAPQTNPSQIPATQLEERQTQAGRRMRVQFRDVELQALLSALAQNEGLNLSIDPAITGTVSIDLDNVTFEEALDAILTPRGLQYGIDGNLLRVATLQMQSRTFSFDYITTARTLGRNLAANANAGLNAAGVAGAGTGIQSGSSTFLNGTETTNLLADVEDALNSLKSPTGRFVFNRMSGLIFVTDFPQNLDAIGLFLETIQNAVNRQVAIEARFIEVQLNSNTQAGINWNAVLGNSVTLTQELGTVGTFRVGVTTADFNLLFSVLSSQGEVNEK
jgi:MSHA biogenesis protein MshL